MSNDPVALKPIVHIDSGGTVAGVVMVGTTVFAITEALVEADGRSIFEVNVKPYPSGPFGISRAFKATEKFGADAMTALIRQHLDRGNVSDCRSDLPDKFDDGEAGHVTVFFGDPSRGFLEVMSWRM